MSVLEKAVSVIEVLGRAEGPLRLGAIADATVLPKSSLHRLLAELSAHGLVHRAGEGQYSLGRRLVHWGQLADTSFAVQDVARSTMARLRDEVAESVYLYVPEADHRVCVLALDAPHQVRPVALVGQPLPLGYGSGGKVLYAHAIPAIQARVQATTPTWRGCSLPGAEEVDRIRREGWASSSGEMEEGLVAVSARIDGPGGTVVGALTIASVESRTSPERLSAMLPLVTRAAAEIGTSLLTAA